MAHTDVKLSELGDDVREFKWAAQIEEPYDGQIVYFDLKADFDYKILTMRGRLDTESIEAELQVAGVAVAGLDPMTITTGATQEDAPTGGSKQVTENQQVRAVLNFPSGVVSPNVLCMEVVCRIDKDQG